MFFVVQVATSAVNTEITVDHMEVSSILENLYKTNHRLPEKKAPHQGFFSFVSQIVVETAIGPSDVTHNHRMWSHVTPCELHHVNVT